MARPRLHTAPSAFPTPWREDVILRRILRRILCRIHCRILWRDQRETLHP